MAHVKYRDPGRMHQPLFSGIDTANANLAQFTGVQCRTVRTKSAHTDQFFGAVTTQTGCRHAMDIAAGCDAGRIEIGMRIKPQHPQWPALGAAMARHRAD